MLGPILLAITAVARCCRLAAAGPVPLPLLAALAGVGLAWRVDLCARYAAEAADPDTACQPACAASTRRRERIRALPERHGRRTLVVAGADPRASASACAPTRRQPDRATPATTRAPTSPSPSRSTRTAAYGGPEFRDSSDWSPGAPLLYAARLLRDRRRPRRRPRGSSRRCSASPAIFVVYLLGRRLGVPAAAGPARRRGAVAVYPPFIHSTGACSASRRRSSPCPRRSSPSSGPGERGAAPGPGSCPALLLRAHRADPARVPARRRRLRRAGARPASGASAAWRAGAAARRRLLLVALARCRSCPGPSATTIVLDRFVPISTGGGKALYVGTYLPADGEYQRVKAILVERFQGRTSTRTPRRSTTSTRRRSSTASPRATPTCRATRRWARSASDQLSDYLGDDPLGYAGDDRAQGLAHVEQPGSARRWQSTAGRVDPGDRSSLLGLARPRRCSPRAAAAEALVLRGPDRRRSPAIGARHAGAAAAQRDADDARLPACRCSNRLPRWVAHRATYPARPAALTVRRRLSSPPS